MTIKPEYIELNAVSYGRLLGDIRFWQSRGYQLVQTSKLQLNCYSYRYRAIMSLNHDHEAVKLTIRVGQVTHQ